MRIKKLTGGQERPAGSPQEKKINWKKLPWGKILYLAFLFMLFFGVLRIAYERFLCVKGRGVLVAETTKIESMIVARISDIPVKLGDEVEKGAPVVYLDKSELQLDILSKERTLLERSNLFLKRVTDIDNEMKLLEESMKNANAELEELRSEHERAQKLLKSRVITRDQLLKIEQNYRMAERETSFLFEKLALSRTKREVFEKEHDEYWEKVNEEIKQLHALLAEAVLRSPIKGIVTKKFKEPGEVAEIAKAILEISDLSGNFVLAFFSVEDENEVSVGQKVRLYFDNGKKSKGRIRKIYPATFSLNPQYKKPYGRQERNITVEIEPLKGASWPGILRTKVKVLRKKFI